MVWLILALLLWGIIHSLLASLKAKELVLRWAGAGVLRFYRLFYNAFAILSFVPILVIVAMTKSATLYTVPFPWSYLMILGEFLAIVVLGLGLLQTDPWEFIGLRQLGNASKQASLNTAGLYRYVRHPLYV
ncbi:MAG TPA: hypothetical protein VMT91_08620, partial [Anaerolineales bacterium]|nr:hypothetical protein [Anaerolineales bacterium]